MGSDPMPYTSDQPAFSDSHSARHSDPMADMFGNQNSQGFGFDQPAQPEVNGMGF